MRNSIAQAIKGHGYTQTRLAEEMNVSPATLSKSINGNPTLSTLRQIASILGCSVGELVDE